MGYSSAYQPMAMNTNYVFREMQNGETPSEGNFVLEKLAKTYETVKAEAEKYYPMARFVGDTMLNYAAQRKQDDWLTRYGRWYQEAGRVGKMSISDENKHQYMSCRAAEQQIPKLGYVTGIAKEAFDLAKKLKDEKEIKKYNGKLGVVWDSVKDMKNNTIGLGYGMLSFDPDCESLLEEKIW